MNVNRFFIFSTILAATVAAGSVDAATVFDLRGRSGLATAHLFNSGGVNLTATGAAYDWSGNLVTDGVRVGRYGHGLGVTNSRSDNSHTVDGSGWKDVVVLSFDRQIRLKGLKFGYAATGEQVTLMDSGLNVLDTFTLRARNGYAWLDLSDHHFADDAFGIKAPGHHDDWKLAKVKVTSVPTPATAAGGLVLLSILGSIRSRNA